MHIIYKMQYLIIPTVKNNKAQKTYANYVNLLENDQLCSKTITNM